MGKSQRRDEKYIIAHTARSLRIYNKLVKKDHILRNKVEKIFEDLQENPKLGEKFTCNLLGFRGYHFEGNKYRIIYKTIDECSTTVEIHKVSHRKKSYSDLALYLQKGK